MTYKLTHRWQLPFNRWVEDPVLKSQILTHGDAYEPVMTEKMASPGIWQAEHIMDASYKKARSAWPLPCSWSQNGKKENSGYA